MDPGRQASLRIVEIQSEELLDAPKTISKRVVVQS
jgi:hypothetical protein